MLLNQENTKMSSGGKFAIIGKGFIFEKHAQAIKEIRGEIVDIVDKSQGEKAWKNMVQNTKADYVVILAPNNLHFEMAKFVAEKGKMVLCEKPLTIKSKEAKILAKYPDIFTVCQLRYHPLVKKLKSEIKKDKKYEIGMDISVHRDEDYLKSWKGKIERSGGILFNIGIHYFDLLLYLFGEPIEILTKSLTDRRGEGVIKGKNYLCSWKISAEEAIENQRRLFKINGTNYDFSSKTELPKEAKVKMRRKFSSPENFHSYVYKDLLEEKGVSPKEALKSIELIEKIYENFKK